MIKAEIMDGRIGVNVEGSRLELANEFAAICATMLEHYPDVFTTVMIDVLSSGDDEEEEEEAPSLDDLFGDVMEQLNQLSIRKTGGNNNAKS